jgi:hypothetical protein
MKNTLLLIGLVSLLSCKTSIKLAIPDTFKQQATLQHVDGARGNKMSFGSFTTSRIKRGAHISSPGWGRDFTLENLLWNQIGIQKEETIKNERTKFRYTISDGKNTLEIYAREEEFTRSLDYELFKSNSLFNSFEQVQAYKYVFSALIGSTTTPGEKSWELLMTNIYDRKAQNDKNPFSFIRHEDDGLATNGQDTIYIKPLSIKTTELSNGKTAQLPFKLLSGYELSNSDGVIAIMDAIDRNIWFYNELETSDRLIVGAISTAIFARRVRDVKW